MDPQASAHLSPATPTPAAKPPFRLHWSCGFLALIYAGLYLAAVLATPSRIWDPYSVGYVVGTICSGIGIPLLLAYLAYRLARRSNRAGNAIFLIVMLMVTISPLALVGRGLGVGPVLPKGLQGSGNPKLKDALAAGREAQREQIERARGGEVTTGGLERLEGKFETLQDNGNSEEATIARLVLELTAYMKPAITKLETATVAAVDRTTGVADLLTLDSQAELASRLKLIRDWREANAEFIDVLNKMPAVSHNLAVKHLKDARKVKSFDAGFNQQFGMQSNLRYRASVEQFCKTTQTVLEFLNDHWGKWEILQEDQALVLVPPHDSGALQDSWVQLATELNEVSAAFVEEEERFLEAVERRSANQAN